MVAEEREALEVRERQVHDLEVEKELLLQRNVQLQSKLEKVRTQGRLG